MRTELGGPAKEKEVLSRLGGSLGIDRARAAPIVAQIARMAELVDAADSKSAEVTLLWVRVPLRAPYLSAKTLNYNDKIQKAFRSIPPNYPPFDARLRVLSSPERCPEKHPDGRNGGSRAASREDQRLRCLSRIICTRRPECSGDGEPLDFAPLSTLE